MGAESWISLATLGVALAYDTFKHNRTHEDPEDRPPEPDGPDGYGSVAGWMGGRGPTHLGVSPELGGRGFMTPASGEDGQGEQEQYGVAPALALPLAIPAAITLSEVVIVAGVAGASVGGLWYLKDPVGFKDAVRRAWEATTNAAAALTGASATALAIEQSQYLARRAATAEQTIVAAATAEADITINSKCAWILSPFLIFERAVEIMRPGLLNAGYSAQQIEAAANLARKTFGFGKGELVQLLKKFLGGAGASYSSMMLGVMGGMIVVFLSEFGFAFSLMMTEAFTQLLDEMNVCAKGLKAHPHRIRAILAWLRQSRVVILAIKLLRVGPKIARTYKRSTWLIRLALTSAFIVEILHVIGALDSQDVEQVWAKIGDALKREGISRKDVQDAVPTETIRSATAQAGEAEEGGAAWMRARAIAEMQAAMMEGISAIWEGPEGTEIVSSSGVHYAPGPVPEDLYSLFPTPEPSVPERMNMIANLTYSFTGRGWRVSSDAGTADAVVCGRAEIGVEPYWETPTRMRPAQLRTVMFVGIDDAEPPSGKLVAKTSTGVVEPGDEFQLPTRVPPATYDLYIAGKLKLQDLEIAVDDCPYFIRKKAKATR
jgi:hypothetical protein